MTHAIRTLAAASLAAFAFSMPVSAAVANDPVPCTPDSCPQPCQKDCEEPPICVVPVDQSLVAELRNIVSRQQREMDRMQARLDRKNETIAELREQLAARR